MIASPYAKKLAREAGVDIADATATGLGGRIVAADVEQLVKSGASCLAVSRLVLHLQPSTPRAGSQHCMRLAATECTS